MSIVSLKRFLVPDLEAERTVWGRIDQGRRELAVALRKDVTVEKLAELIDLRGPSLAQWKSGKYRPTRPNVEKLERLFVGAGLHRYTAQYIDYGTESRLSKAPMFKGKGPPPNESRDAKEG